MPFSDDRGGEGSCRGAKNWSTKIQDMQSGQGGACVKVKGKSRLGYIWKKRDEASKIRLKVSFK